MDSAAVAAKVWAGLGALSLLQWCLATGLGLVVGVLATLGFLRWLLARSWQLHRRLKRPIVVLHPLGPSGDVMPGGSLDSILPLLRGGPLNVKDGITDHRYFTPTGDHCVVVLGYKCGMVGLRDLLARLKTKHVPLIVYTYGANSVTGVDKQLFDEYPYTVFANFPLTLLNHIFATVASFPYGR